MKPSHPDRKKPRSWPKALDTPVKRRLVLGGASAVGIAGVGGWMSLPSASNPSTQGTNLINHLHIIAHPDDDLYFFNPDVKTSVEAGHGIINVCITGGEGNGKNGNEKDLSTNFNGYVASRYEGLRAAYAEMVETNRHAKWRREILNLGGKEVELATLEEAPQIHLVFLNLWEDSAKSPESTGKRLRHLWSEQTHAHDTLTPDGGPIDKPTTYSKTELSDTLVRLLEMYQPVVVRTLDPDPDPQQHNANTPQYSDQDGYSDHVDHTTVGLIALDTVEKWHKQGGGHNTIVEAYRGYYNRRWPRNLSPKALKTKTRYTDIYAWNDNRSCDVKTGCGDLKIGEPSIGNAFGASTVHRYPAATNWLQYNADGAPFAITSQRGGLVRYRKESGSKWVRTRDNGSPKLLPAVQLIPNKADVWYALGVEATTGTTPAEHERNIVIRPFTFTGANGTWTHLGNPESGASDPRRRRSIGTPTATLDSDGMLVVAVRDAKRHLAVCKQERDNSFTDWQRVDGSTIQDGLSAVTSTDGYLEIFGAAKNGVARWWQEPDDNEWHHEVIDTTAPAGPPTAIALPDGGTMLVVRRSESSGLSAYYRGHEEQNWDTAGHDLDGEGGAGTVAAAAPPNWDGKVALASRNDYGTVSFAIVDTAARAMELEWGSYGPHLMHAPSLAVSPQGKVTVAALATDGDLYHASQTETGFARPKEWKSATESV